MNYKKKSIIAFLFFLIFPLATYPIFSIFQKSENVENRTLADFPEFELETIEEYPAKLEAFFTDYLPYKNYLIQIYSAINYFVFDESPTQKVVWGKDNWLFYTGEKGEDPISDYQGTNVYTEMEMEIIKENLVRTETYLRKQGKEFILFLAPNKEQVYSNFMPDYYKVVNSQKRYDVLANYLKQNTDITIIDPKDELIAEKDKYQVYKKYDTHWNELGGFIGAQQLLEHLSGERLFLDDVCIKEQGQATTDLAKLVNLPHLFNDDVEYFVSPYKVNVKEKLVKKSSDGFYKKYISNSSNKKNLLVIRDSFGEQLYPYLSKEFSEVTFLHRNVCSSDKVNKENADIVVYEIVERNLDMLKSEGIGIVPN